MNSNILAKEAAENFVVHLFSIVSDDYKRKYKSEIWRLFEDALRISLYKRNLQEAFESFKRNIPCDVSSFEAIEIASFLSNDEEYLSSVHDLLRSNLAYVVLLARHAHFKNKER